MSRDVSIRIDSYIHSKLSLGLPSALNGAHKSDCAPAPPKHSFFKVISICQHKLQLSKKEYFYNRGNIEYRMKFLAQVIEQIEEAANQLDKQTVTGSRLALILIDNLIEILMYNCTKDELTLDDQIAIIYGTYLFMWDEIPGSDSSRFIEFLNKKYNIDWVKTENIKKTDDTTISVSTEKKFLSLKLNKEQNRVNLEIDDCRTAKFISRTQNGNIIVCETYKDKYPEFKNKTQFLLSYEIISLEHKVIMDICHKFRNEAYHANKLHDRIIDQIVKVYFAICCEILPELIGGRSSIGDTEDPFLAKYGISVYRRSSFGNIFSPEKFKELIKKFSAGREYNNEKLSKLLSSDIEERVINVRKNLKEISDNDSQNSYTDFENRLKLILLSIEKLKIIINSSKALKKYFELDKDLLDIELNVDLIDAILDYRSDLAFEEQREREVFGDD